MKYEIIKLLKNTAGTQELESVLKAVLTPSELEETAKRLDILAMLTSAKFTQREIAKHLKVGLATVSRGAEVVKKLEETKPRWWKDFKSW